MRSPAGRRDRRLRHRGTTTRSAASASCAAASATSAAGSGRRARRATAVPDARRREGGLSSCACSARCRDGARGGVRRRPPHPRKAAPRRGRRWSRHRGRGYAGDRGGGEGAPCVRYIGRAARPLRQDGAQRDRVRDDATSWRGGALLPPGGAGAPQFADFFEELTGGDLQSYLVEVTAAPTARTTTSCCSACSSARSRAGPGGSTAPGCPAVDALLDGCGAKGTGGGRCSAGRPRRAVRDDPGRARRARCRRPRASGAGGGAPQSPTGAPRAGARASRRLVRARRAQAALYSLSARTPRGWHPAGGAARARLAPDLPISVATWCGGCIIRARLDIHAAYRRELHAAAFLDATIARSPRGAAGVAPPSRSPSSRASHPALLRHCVVMTATAPRCSCRRSGQAQCDSFGAHGFMRLDRDGAFTAWGAPSEAAWRT